jgi:acyl-CoA thioester hydrolase
MTGTPQPDRVHRHPIRVYFEDTDAGGMAYHATYLRWAERARTESLRALGLPHQQMIERHHSLLVVRRVEVEYLRPARLDAALVVETAILRVTGARSRWTRGSGASRVPGRKGGRNWPG